MKIIAIVFLVWAVGVSGAAQAQGYEGLFEAQDGYSDGGAGVVAEQGDGSADQGNYSGGGVLAGDAAGGSSGDAGYYGADQGGGDGYSDSLGIVPETAYTADGTPIEDDFGSLIVTGARTPAQIRELQNQSLEEQKKKRQEEIVRINAASKARRDLERQKRDRQRMEAYQQQQQQSQKK